MYRDILTNKWFLGGVGFLIVLSVACVLWYQHDIADERKAAADAEEMLRQSEIAKKVSDVDSEAKQATDVTAADSITPTAETPINLTTDGEVEDTPSGDTSTNLTEQAQAKDSTQEVRVSPYGFGPYPKVPADYRAQCGPTSWLQVELYGLPPASRGVELIERVTLKLWKEGDTQVRGGVLENGKVYINYPNRVYVRWTPVTDADGNTTRAISSWLSGTDLPRPTREQMHNGYIPPGVEVIDLDAEDPGIEPYSFLGLDK